MLVRIKKSERMTRNNFASIIYCSRGCRVDETERPTYARLRTIWKSFASLLLLIYLLLQSPCFSALDELSVLYLVYLLRFLHSISLMALPPYCLLPYIYLNSFPCLSLFSYISTPPPYPLYYIALHYIICL